MTDLEKELLRLLDEERAKNDALTELLFKKHGLIEEETLVSVPDNKPIGRLPWYARRRRLEEMFKKGESDAGEISSSMGPDERSSSRSDYGESTEERS